MITITLGELQVDPLACLDRIPLGETALVLDEDNQAIAEIKPLTRPASGDRPYGLCAGQIHLSDDFDDPLPEEILREFEGRLCSTAPLAPPA